MSRVIDIAKHVYKTLGHGHTEALYHRAMEAGLRIQNIQYETEKIVPVSYEGFVVGHCRLDLVTDQVAVWELKSIAAIKAKEITQLKRYMEITGLHRGYVINFPTNGGDVEIHEENNNVDI